MKNTYTLTNNWAQRQHELLSFVEANKTNFELVTTPPEYAQIDFINQTSRIVTKRAGIFITIDDIDVDLLFTLAFSDCIMMVKKEYTYETGFIGNEKTIY